MGVHTKLAERIEAFAQLGAYLKDFIKEPTSSHELTAVVDRAFYENGWFTKQEVMRSLTAWADELTHENIQEWLGKYEIAEPKSPKRVLIVMAGNIPLVGFHDFLSVVLCGHIAVVKPSTDDKVLLQFLVRKLIEISTELQEQIQFVTGIEKNIEAVIATGSNNSSRYFEYYFGKYPHIIRKNRTSVGIIKEETTSEELSALGEDIFAYFGLGCRNVSKLFVPHGFKLDRFFESIVPYSWVADNKKYFNNYEYNKTIYLLNQEPLLDNNFVILRENQTLHSPIGVIHYQRYTSKIEVDTFLENNREAVQCTVNRGVEAGQAQKPKLWDYADGVDTIEFLLTLSNY